MPPVYSPPDAGRRVFLWSRWVKYTMARVLSTMARALCGWKALRGKAQKILLGRNERRLKPVGGCALRQRAGPIGAVWVAGLCEPDQIRAPAFSTAIVCWIIFGQAAAVEMRVKGAGIVEDGHGAAEQRGCQHTDLQKHYRSYLAGNTVYGVGAYSDQSPTLKNVK